MLGGNVEEAGLFGVVTQVTSLGGGGGGRSNCSLFPCSKNFATLLDFSNIDSRVRSDMVEELPLTNTSLNEGFTSGFTRHAVQRTSDNCLLN